MKNKNLIRILMPSIVAVSIVAGMFIGKYYTGSSGADSYVIYPRSDKLTNIINYISRDYVDPVDKSDLVEDAIPKILDDLDPHSQYIPATDFQQVNEPLEGNFSGIGSTV
jgi:carboxyl-terminal processing protease